MRFSRLSWRPSRRSSELPSEELNSLLLPRLPTEIWRKVIGYTVRLAGANTIELDDPFGPPHWNEEYPEIDMGLFFDRRSLSLVCSSWRDVVTEISAEYIVVYSAKQLKRLVKKYESHKNTNGKKLGDWTTRIDFKILGDYNHWHVVRLLRCTPKLMIYTNKNGPGDSPGKCTPIEVLKGLISYCADTLRRVEWSGPGEPPRFQDLAFFCNHLPNLVTLRLMAVYSYPMPEHGAPPILVLPTLKTLSLGIIPEPAELQPEYAVTWDPLLRYLSLHPSQLPALERFDCDLFPLLTMSFFDMHGHKLRVFRTTTCFADASLPEAVAACPNLHHLVISHGAEVVAFPQYHPKLQKICILPSIEVEVGIPQKIFDNAVMSPLDSILKAVENMTAPCLSEVRVRNSGAFVDVIHQVTWLNYWWRRWNIRGIQFRDKAGTSYDQVKDRK